MGKRWWDECVTSGASRAALLHSGQCPLIHIPIPVVTSAHAIQGQHTGWPLAAAHSLTVLHIHAHWNRDAGEDIPAELLVLPDLSCHLEMLKL